MTNTHRPRRTETAAAHAFAVQIPPVGLGGMLSVPDAAKGVILFAHGSGSSRFSPRNRLVAGDLLAAGFGTLLFDLLTEEEAVNRDNVFDIALLARRLALATRWLAAREDLCALPVGYFGASTGAAAALLAAAESGSTVAAVVSRGGRPDLAADALTRVRSPTLLIVGGEDAEVLALNRKAFAALTCPKAIEVVPGASHLFEEPGALETVVKLARRWFVRHVPPRAPEGAP